MTSPYITTITHRVPGSGLSGVYAFPVHVVIVQFHGWAPESLMGGARSRSCGSTPSLFQSSLSSL